MFSIQTMLVWLVYRHNICVYFLELHVNCWDVNSVLELTPDLHLFLWSLEQLRKQQESAEQLEKKHESLGGGDNAN